MGRPPAQRSPCTCWSAAAGDSARPDAPGDAREVRGPVLWTRSSHVRHDRSQGPPYAASALSKLQEPRTQAPKATRAQVERARPLSLCGRRRVSSVTNALHATCCRPAAHSNTIFQISKTLKWHTRPRGPATDPRAPRRAAKWSRALDMSLSQRVSCTCHLVGQQLSAAESRWLGLTYPAAARVNWRARAVRRAPG